MIPLRKISYECNNEEAKVNQSLSKRLWGIPWEKILPHHFQGTEFYLDQSSYSELCDFIKKNSKKIFAENELVSPFKNRDQSEQKERFYTNEADVFCYKLREKIIGVFVINPMDWSTYYFRYTNIHPDYRGHRLTERNLQFLSDILPAYGVERICLEVANSNLEQVQRLSKLGFYITGNSLSDRWGAVLVMTKYLNNEAEKIFLDQFCVGLRPKKTLTQKEIL